MWYIIGAILIGSLFFAKSTKEEKEETVTLTRKELAAKLREARKNKSRKPRKK